MNQTEEFLAGLNLLSSYDFIEQSCEYILKQLSAMQKQRYPWTIYLVLYACTNSRYVNISLVELRIKGVSIKWMYCNPNHMRFYMISPYELDCSISIWMLLRTVWITLTQRPNIFLLHVMQQLCQYCFLPLYSIVFVFGQCTTC